MFILRTKHTRLALVFVVVTSSAYALNDSTAILRFYSKKQSALSFQVLRLYADNTYDYCQYTRKKINRDTGRFVIHKSKLELQSETKKNSFNPYLHKTLFISEAGLHQNRIHALLKKEPLIKPETNSGLYADWQYNPAIKKTPVKPEPEYVPETVAEIPAVVPASVPAKPVSKPAKRTYDPNKPALPAVHVKPMEPGAYAKSYYIAVCSTYATGYDKILEKAYCGPDCYYSVIDGKLVSWNKDTTVSRLFGSIETVIHESVHHYNGRDYLVTPEISINVPRCAIYKSEQVKAIAPADASSKIFRYKTYIGDSSYVSVNQSGIFGLLDEFSAYSHGVRFSVKAAEGAMARGDTALARAFLGQASSTSYAYYEFNLFMGWYVHFAKTNHPDIYKEMMAANNLRLAYTLLDQEFAATNKRLLELVKLSGKSGWGFSELADASAGKGYIAPLLKAEQPYLDAFKLAGATNANYKTFLKTEE